MPGGVQSSFVVQVNFGDVQWGREVEFPRPARVGALRGVHGVASDPVVVVDAQTLLVPNFSYDGEAPGQYYGCSHLCF